MPDFSTSRIDRLLPSWITLTDRRAPNHRARGGATLTKLFAIRRLRQAGKADEGQALVLIALAPVVLMLITGLGLNVRFPRYQGQQVQKAAGAAESVYGTSALASVATQNHTATNGFTNGNNGTTATVNNPPKSGPYINNIEYVEGIVPQAQPTFFMRVGGVISLNIRSLAVTFLAGKTRPGVSTS